MFSKSIGLKFALMLGVALMLGSLLALAGFNSNSNSNSTIKDIQHKWKKVQLAGESTPVQTVEFYSDNTAKFIMKGSFANQFKATYKLSGDKLIVTITNKIEGITTIYNMLSTVEVANGVLTLSRNGSVITRWEKTT
ncbi:MAG: hypothetical protein ACJAS1_000816 [Oleiphilaceae bacterium]|jgi:hypothetical protein